MKILVPLLLIAAAALRPAAAAAQAAILPGGAGPAPKAAPAVPAAASPAANAVALAPVTPAAKPNALKVKADVNPATNKLTVKTDFAGPTRVEVTDAAGRPILTYTMMNGTTPALLNVGQLPAGSYIVRCTAYEKSGMRRIMIGQ